MNLFDNALSLPTIIMLKLRPLILLQQQLSFSAVVPFPKQL